MCGIDAGELEALIIRTAIGLPKLDRLAGWLNMRKPIIMYTSRMLDTVVIDSSVFVVDAVLMTMTLSGVRYASRSRLLVVVFIRSVSVTNCGIMVAGRQRFGGVLVRWSSIACIRRVGHRRASYSCVVRGTNTILMIVMIGSHCPSTNSPKLHVTFGIVLALPERGLLGRARSIVVRGTGAVSLLFLMMSAEPQLE